MHFSLSLALSAADIGSVFCNSEESPLKGLRLLAIKFAGEIFHIAFRTVSRTTSLTLDIYFTCLQIFQFLNKAVGAGEPVVIKKCDLPARGGRGHQLEAHRPPLRVRCCP